VQSGGARLFMSRNKVMSVALGKSEQDEYLPALYKVSQQLQGNCAILLCNEPNIDKIQQLFNTPGFKKADFARAGYQVQETVELPAGEVEWMPSSYEERMVRLSLPIEVKNAKIHLRYPVTVCKAGDTLTPEASKILVRLRQLQTTQQFTRHKFLTKQLTFYRYKFFFLFEFFLVENFFFLNIETLWLSPQCVQLQNTLWME